MSVVARLEVVPTGEVSMSDAIARAVAALDGFDVSYEVTATDTVLEAADASEVFAAAAAAHRAVRDERVITSLEVDDQPGRVQQRENRVASVEQELGRPARREKPQAEQSQMGRSRTSQSQMGRTQTDRASTKRSRYLRTEPPTPR